MRQHDDPIQVNCAVAGRRWRRAGQSLTEFGLVLPLILLFAFGIFEFGRILYIFSEVNNASREAARYGASVGEQGTGTTRYLDCAAMRAAARNTAILSGLRNDEIEIAYDRNDGSGGMAIFAHCGDAGLDPSDIILGDRIVITVTKTVTPMLGLLPIPSFSPVTIARRTILKDLPLGHPECRDGVDNDGDGAIDYPADSGCSSPDDTIEAICYRLSAVPQLNAPPDSIYEDSIDFGSVDIGPASNCTARYLEQTEVTLQAIANPPTYTFAYWGSDASGTTNPLVFSINSDKDIVAHFRPRTAELSVIKFVNSYDPIGVGEPFTYMIQVSNAYTETATNVVLTDTLPIGVTLVDVSIPGGCANSVNESGQTVIRCDQLGPIGTGPPVMGSITVNAPMSPGDIDNNVTVSAFEYDPILSNNTYTETTTVIPLADLSVDKSDSPYDPVYAGELLTYTITIKNNGPSPATGVVLTDTLPSGVGLNSSSHTCAQDGNIVTCAVGDLGVSASNNTAVIQLTVTTPAQGGVITNQVTVSANEVDRDPSNNSASEDTTVNPHADLDIQKRVSADPATRDVPFSYQLTVTNNGPSIATGVVVVDTLPENVDYLSSTTSSGYDCDFSGNSVTCSLGDMAGGQSELITIEVMPTAEGVIANTATVTGDVLDRNTSNNSDTETTTVEARVSLTLIKSGPGTATVGEEIVYEISVNNSGPSNATNVVVTDTLSGDITFGGVSYTGNWSCGSYDIKSGQLVCRLPQLDASATAGFSIRVTATTSGTVSNSASATADEDTTGVASNTVITIVEPSADPIAQ